MGKLIEPKKHWIKVVEDVTDWDGCIARKISIVCDFDHVEKVQSVFDAADCVAETYGNDDHGLCCIVSAAIDPRCDFDDSRNYIIQAILRKLSPRHWRTILMDEFCIDPDC